MTSDQNKELLTERAERIFEAELRYPDEVTDRRIVEAVHKLLTPGERACVDFATAVVAGTKLILVCEDPESVREIIFVEGLNPRKVHRRRLALKRKKNPANT